MGLKGRLLNSMIYLLSFKRNNVFLAELTNFVNINLNSRILNKLRSCFIGTETNRGSELQDCCWNIAYVWH